MTGNKWSNNNQKLTKVVHHLLKHFILLFFLTVKNSKILQWNWFLIAQYHQLNHKYDSFYYMVFTRKERKDSSHSFQWRRVIMTFYTVPHYMHFNVFAMWPSKYKKQHCMQYFCEVEKMWLLFEKDWEEVLCCSHRCLIRVRYQHILIHLIKEKEKERTWAVTETTHKFVWIVHLPICIVVLFVWSLPSRILQMRLCHWGDGPHTGSTAAPELSPSGYTVALHRHLSCSAFKRTTAN